MSETSVAEAPLCCLFPPGMSKHLSAQRPPLPLQPTWGSRALLSREAGSCQDLSGEPGGV